MRSKMAIMAVAGMLISVLVSTSGAAAAAGRTVYYVSLGDSAAAGVQPPGWNALGYADQLSFRMRARLPQLRLVKLGCPGETTESLLSGADSPCSYPSGSQLEEAVGVLRAHAGSVAFITINVGVNDVLDACLDDAAGALDPACTRGLLPAVQANLAAIVRTLGDAAPGVPIAGMSYWDPFLGFWVTGPEGEARARTSNQAMQVLNAGLVSTYRGEGALVADVAGPGFFNIADFSHRVASRWGPVPVNVANACTLTWSCARPPLGPDPHPNTRGYRVIADAFAAVLPGS
ncbi:MAG TPA: SGNH/GDSL hydrolase family protein [Acidimicrobiales bacterium]|nr:SGNH/GDSL hydrolase family protein [Acidimicrobiales bacterium]HWI02963.1 SGNH/GDSL hydrolase family protein [Acidimicrobiales bacterium]